MVNFIHTYEGILGCPGKQIAISSYLYLETTDFTNVSTAGMVPILCP